MQDKIGLYCLTSNNNFSYVNLICQEHGFKYISVFCNDFEKANRYLLDGVQIIPMIDFPFGLASTAERICSVKWFLENNAPSVDIQLSQNFIDSKNQQGIMLDVEKIIESTKSKTKLCFMIPAATSIMDSGDKLRIVERVIKNTSVKHVGFSCAEGRTTDNILLVRKIKNSFPGMIKVFLGKTESYNIETYFKSGADQIILPYDCAVQRYWQFKTKESHSAEN